MGWIWLDLCVVEVINPTTGKPQHTLSDRIEEK